MTEEKTTEEQKEKTKSEETKTDPPKAPDTGTASGDSGGTEDDDLTKKIREVVKEVLGSDSSRRPVIARQADIEKQAEQMVRDAQKRLAEDEAHKAEHEELKKKVEKPVEEAPKKVRRLTKALWGEDK